MLLILVAEEVEEVGAVECLGLFLRFVCGGGSWCIHADACGDQKRALVSSEALHDENNFWPPQKQQALWTTPAPPPPPP